MADAAARQLQYEYKAVSSYGNKFSEVGPYWNFFIFTYFMHSWSLCVYHSSFIYYIKQYNIKQCMHNFAVK